MNVGKFFSTTHNIFCQRHHYQGIYCQIFQKRTCT